MNGISFNLANYVARQVGWNMTGGWGQGEKSNSDHFRPIKTFGPRFEQYLKEIAAMGYTATDLWSGVIDPRWATPEHISTALDLLRQYNIEVTSFGGHIGANEDELVATCELASSLGAPILGGGTAMLRTDRDFLVATLQKYGLLLGYENHPEKTPAEVLAIIGDGGEGTIGACVDTGWFGTQGYDAADALSELAPHLFIVHLKDVRAVGAHDTCRYGEGVVPVERCVRVLQEIGYTGDISVEHEPDTFDPTEDLIANLQMLKGWLAQ